ncbi:MAG: GNAT family N-acetyltransferase [Thermoplasmatota archaeon]
MSSSVKMRHVKSWPPGDIISLYKAGNWWKEDYDRSGIPPLIEGSFDFIVAYDEREEEAVGMGRLISDGVSDGYIQDVVVLPDRRGEGIGSSIVRELVGQGKKRGLVWVGLIAEKGSSSFYERLGFKKFDGEPMLYGEDK